MTKPKVTHIKKTEKEKKQSRKRVSTKSHAALDKRPYSDKRPKKNKNNNNNNDDDEDNNNNQLKKKRKESNQDNIDDYLNDYSYLKPSSKLLHKFEEDVRVAQLLFAENSGYDYSNSAIILDELRSDDNDIREEAIDKYLELIKTAIPNLNEQASIRDNYYALGGHHELVLQACGCCGRNDYSNFLNGELYEIDF
jgi:hypothetical protein